MGTMQLDVMKKFYTEVFEKQPEMEDGDWNGWSVGSTFFTLGTHSEMEGMSKDPGRIMFNLETEEVQDEFARISAIPGATIIKEPYSMEGAWIATLADPDGNYFQLMTPWKADEDK